MSAIKLSTPSSGSISLSPANTASNLTITVPAVTGTMITTASTFAGTGPAFSAYQSASQTISGGVYTKITFTTKEFDTNTNYDTSTSRFTPTVSGYYQVDASVTYTNATAGEALRTLVYKNGTVAKNGNLGTSIASQGASSIVSAIIYMNGSTDYLEVYIYASGLGGTTPTNNAANTTWFQAALVRAA